MHNAARLEYGKYYHIYNRGNAGENIFREARNYLHFLSLYSRYIEPVAETFAYCLLGNHFHLVVRIRERACCRVAKPQGAGWSLLSPSQEFSNLFNAYTKSINKAYGRTGNLFHRPFARIEITSNAYLTHLVHYVHFNAQKHGFVKDYRDYPYSSYAALCSDKPTRLSRDVVLAWFNGPEQFEQAHSRAINERAIAGLIDDDLD